MGLNRKHWPGVAVVVLVFGVAGVAWHFAREKLVQKQEQEKQASLASQYCLCLYAMQQRTRYTIDVATEKTIDGQIRAGCPAISGKTNITIEPPAANALLKNIQRHEKTDAVKAFSCDGLVLGTHTLSLLDGQWSKIAPMDEGEDQAGK